MAKSLATRLTFKQGLFSLQGLPCTVTRLTLRQGIPTLRQGLPTLRQGLPTLRKGLHNLQGLPTLHEKAYLP